MKNCCILIILIMGKLDIINKVLNKDNSNEMKEHSEEVVMDIKIVNRNNLKYALFRFCNLVYKADHFARVEGLQRMCDYFLFVEARNVLYVFIVELKSTSGSSALKQLNAGECFVNYIINSANRIGEGIDIADCKIRKIKAKKHVKRRIKCQVEFDKDGYCGDYCFSQFDIIYMLDRV